VMQALKDCCAAGHDDGDDDDDDNGPKENHHNNNFKFFPIIADCNEKKRCQAVLDDYLLAHQQSRKKAKAKK
jgi:hypothetical protein